MPRIGVTELIIIGSLLCCTFTLVTAGIVALVVLLNRRKDKETGEVPGTDT